MNHGTIVQQNSRGSARDEFRRFCLRLFDYELWNHIPQVTDVFQDLAMRTVDQNFTLVGYSQKSSQLHHTIQTSV